MPRTYAIYFINRRNSKIWVNASITIWTDFNFPNITIYTYDMLIPYVTYLPSRGYKKFPRNTLIVYNDKSIYSDCYNDEHTLKVENVFFNLHVIRAPSIISWGRRLKLNLSFFSPNPPPPGTTIWLTSGREPDVNALSQQGKINKI